MTINQILDMKARTEKKMIEPISTIIEWCKVLQGTETIDTDEYYSSDGYNYEVEFNIARNELSKCPNMPTRYPIGNGKRNYLLHKSNKNIALLNSGSREYQIILKFTDEYQLFREKRERDVRVAIERKNENTRKRLESYTGKILFTWEARDVGANHYDSQEETSLVTLKDGKIVDTSQIYSRDFSSNSDIYVVVDHGKTLVSEVESGSKANIPHSDNYIHIKDGYFSTDLGYWEVVKKWWDELTVLVR